MNLLNYIRGHRKGKEANRLEKESMKDPLLADALEGYSQVEGDHEKHIKELQQKMKVTARSHRKKNTYAITWSIAACLVIGIGISSYLLFLKGDPSNNELFLTQEQSAPNKNDIIQREQSSPYADNKEMLDSNQIAQNKASKQEEKSQRAVDDVTNRGDVMEMRMVIIDSASADTLLPSPEPLIGRKEYIKYLDNNQTRPQSNECGDLFGRVFLGFKVNKEGRPYDIIVKKGICPAYDKEAVQLVKEGPAWKYSNAPGNVAVMFY